MAQTVVKLYGVDPKTYTPQVKPEDSGRREKLTRPEVHALGRIEQILACAGRLRDRESEPG